MNTMELAKRIVDYVDEASRDYNSVEFGVPRRSSIIPGAKETRGRIESHVESLLSDSQSPPPTPIASGDSLRAVAVLISSGVLTQRQWDAAVAFVDAIGEGAK